MPVSEDIHRVVIADEFRDCTHCGYEKGFHVSLLRISSGHPHFHCVLICPECGTRYDTGWLIDMK